MEAAKPFQISKQLVWDAYKLVKANGGAAGVDRQSLEEFEQKRDRNLYRIWNRMASGSYFPPPVRAVPIPKKSGGTRVLGIPTVSDRIAQTVVKLVLEPELEPHFHADSYGYRPGKSAHQALAVTRKRCWWHNWVVEFDIRKLFDNIDHSLLMKALRKHTSCKWVLLYVERWLKAPMRGQDGVIVTRDRGTPQGGVVSPLLANLFLHYAFDAWMVREYPDIPFCRYADDGLVHCRSRAQAKHLRKRLEERFRECHLEVHPDKTRIVYCQDHKRRDVYETIRFDFLGYTFRPRLSKDRYDRRFVSFTPAVSRTAMKSMRQELRRLDVQLWTDRSIEQVAAALRPKIQGWLNYYGRYRVSAMSPIWRHANHVIVRWAQRKHLKFKGHKTRAARWLHRIASRQPDLFPHWRYFRP